MSELMSQSEIHDFGVEVVFEYLRKEGHEIVAVNTDLSVNPQIVSKHNGQLEFIVVRTATYPNKGALDASTKSKCITFAANAGATCYFASVGIANASVENDAEMSRAIKGAGFHVAFDGIEVLHKL